MERTKLCEELVVTPPPIWEGKNKPPAPKSFHSLVFLLPVPTLEVGWKEENKQNENQVSHDPTCLLPLCKKKADKSRDLKVPIRNILKIDSDFPTEDFQ